MRTWNSNGTDDGSRHVIGNGGMLVYGIGPNVEYVYGPPYSSPPMIGMEIQPDGADLRSESERIPATAVWKHRITQGEAAVARITDYMLTDRNVFVREIEANSALRLRLVPMPGIRAVNLGASWLFSYTRGPTFLAYDPVTEESDLLATVQGDAGFTNEGADVQAPCIQIRPGKCRIVLAAGTCYPELLRNTSELLADINGRHLAQTIACWKEYAARRTDFASLIPEDHPLGSSILDAIDSVSVLLKCHQSASGGVAPGHRYSPMAYVRDMAGVVRGYLALGYTEEVKAILRFWKAKWDRFGNLQNAEGMGDDSVRLSGGNNEVEVPAYVLLCVLAYAECTQDAAVLEEMRPMLEWAFEVQLPHLAGGMTEFSNDETYIAGGIFPRLLMFQGSAESTLLFIAGGSKLADWAERYGWWYGERLKQCREAIAEASALFKPNFMPEGVLYANQPSREDIAGKPRFQFGFCDAHGQLDGQLVNRWLELQEQGYYLCAACKGRAMPDPEVDRLKRYVLNSVNLLPLYWRSELFSQEEIRSIIQPGIDHFRSTGKIPSDLGGVRSLGYDYGLMLYNAAVLNDPVKESLIGKVMGLLDPTEAWVEYYDDDRPAACCRARPWESAINIEAVAAYIRSLAAPGGMQHEQGAGR